MTKKDFRGVWIVLGVTTVLGCASLRTHPDAPVPAAPGMELKMPPAVQMDGGIIQLNVKMHDYTLEGGTEPVSVRTRAFTVPGGTLLASPTIRARPGDTLNIDFHNHLVFTPSQGDDYMSNTIPHGFDVLNLHTHGLHVSPSGNSDNALMSIYPTDTPRKVIDHCKEHMGKMGPDADCVPENFTYKIEIPKTHPAGTYWYHPHKHGAVAMHLSSGMAGALIIEDPQHGIDSLKEVRAAAEKILLLQKIVYASTSKKEQEPSEVQCGDVYTFACCKYPDPGTPCPKHQPKLAGLKATNAESANAKLSVNGQFNPTITLEADEVQLWRVVNTTVGNVIPLCLVPAEHEAPVPEMFVLTADGIPLRRHLPPGAPNLPFKLGEPVSTLLDDDAGRVGVVNNELLFLSPGQRLDLMVKAPSKPGLYHLAQPHPSPDGDHLPNIHELCKSKHPSQVERVMQVRVVPRTGTSPTALPTQTSLNDLYVPDSLAQAGKESLDPTQGVVFGFATKTFAPSAGGASLVNGRPFTEERVQRILTLNQLDVWSVQSAADTHMFHIHTNPFQLTQRGQVPYAFPIWRDTVLINCARVLNGNCTFPGGLTQPDNSKSTYGEIVQFRSRALNYTGAMVMHCHNVTHEDNGMMELINLVNSPPKVAPSQPSHMETDHSK